MFDSIKFWLYRRKHGIPHPREINPFLVKQQHLRELAKLYCAGFTLETCALAIESMEPPKEDPRFNEHGARLPMRNFGARLFLGRRHTRERLRQLIWKFWREQRVGSNVRTTLQD